MRIISGRFRGKVIMAPDSLPVRPTTDFAKTGLFNILANHYDFTEIAVLDLFCGTGNISYEFFSRGCGRLTCVDENYRCIKFVRDTFEKLGGGPVRIYRSDAFRFLERSNDTFDIIFADPPYDLHDSDRIPGIVFGKKLLKAGGLLIVEHESRRTLKSELIPSETRRYGNCAFSMYRHV